MPLPNPPTDLNRTLADAPFSSSGGLRAHACTASSTSVSLPPAWLGVAIAASSASVAPAIARLPAAPIPDAFELDVERQWHAFTCILLCMDRGPRSQVLRGAIFS